MCVVWEHHPSNLTQHEHLAQNNWVKLSVGKCRILIVKNKDVWLAMIVGKKE